MIVRRRLLATLAGGALLAVLPAEAQQPEKVWRIGFLHSGSRNSPNIKRSIEEGFLRGMQDLGYVEGKNLQVEWRFAEGNIERLQVMATELVRVPVSLIVAGPSDPVRAAQRATSTIPIVMAAVSDPVERGFVSNLRRPGGNTTGLTIMVEEVGIKWIELLRDAVPHLGRVAVLLNTATPEHSLYLKQSERAARATGIRTLPIRLKGPEDIPSAVQFAARESVGAVLIPADPVLSGRAKQIIDLAAQHQLPTMFANYFAVEQGGFMSYGPDITDQWRRAAAFVDKILKGARPGDLPVEQPTKFELAVNLKTAKTIGVVVPQSILLRADRVIE